MTKRQRCDDPAWWSLLRDDVVSNGGFVHPHLQFLEADRTLSVEQKVSKGEVVLRIPAKSFMTKDRALSMCHPWLEAILKAEGTSVPWANSTTDIAIAVAMASSPDSFLYLHSLPESSSFDALPRRWSEEKIRNLLPGTSILRHVMSAKTGATEDYKLLLERYRKYQIETNNNDNASPFPSFEKFSDMAAAVTSRAFQIGTNDEDIAIVPILDLGNHTRGKSSTKLGKKNVSYQFDVSEDAMIVKSTVDIDAGESIRLTYGAKSNAQLLLNYGFCIPYNLEPDGSSNDILEYRALSSLGGDHCGDSSNALGEKITLLRAGPKSYSYGGFVAALEEYFSFEKSTSVQEQNGVPDDLEDFLGQCENEEEGGDDFVDLYGGEPKSESQDDSLCIEENYRDEVEALRMFKLDLIKLRKGYSNWKGSILLRIKSGFEGSELYSMILSMSELRTIYFFVHTIHKLQNLLNLQDKKKHESETVALDMVLHPDDLEMIDKQTDDLAKAYMSIRHGGF